MPKRAINLGEGSEAGQHRQNLYHYCISQHNRAVAAGFYIEAVSIVDSLLSDRLESRLACKHGQHEIKRQFSTVGKLATELKGKKANEPDHARELYSDINQWASQRNKVVHQLVKLEEKETPSWNARYERARETAIRGLALFRKLDLIVKVLNKSDHDTA